jgi:hypothetical protein
VPHSEVADAFDERAQHRMSNDPESNVPHDPIDLPETPGPATDPADDPNHAEQNAEADDEGTDPAVTGGVTADSIDEIDKGD